MNKNVQSGLLIESLYFSIFFPANGNIEVLQVLS